MKDKKGWLIYNGGLTSDKFMEINYWYKEVAQTKGITLKLIKNNEIYSMIANESMIKMDVDLGRPDFVLFLDKDIRLAKQLEKLGYNLFNKAEVIALCDDKILTHQALSNKGIKMPKSIISPMMFQGTKEANHDFVDFVEKELGYPLVVKEAFGSFGQQVYLVESRGQLIEKRKELLYTPHLYQEFIRSSKGRDVRLQVVGDQVVASVLRTSDLDFRANVTNGGKMHQFEPPESFVEMAIKAAQIIGVDFAGVDLLFGESEEPIICEINSNAHIKNIYHCTGVDVAEHIFDHILRQVKTV